MISKRDDKVNLFTVKWQPWQLTPGVKNPSIYMSAINCRNPVPNGKTFIFKIPCMWDTKDLSQ